LGHTDWYLPGKDELNTLYFSNGAIGGFDTSGGPYSWYWSSSEFNSSGAWLERFSDGFQSNSNYTNKSITYLVRCVRK
jgi:hypothetical protein